MTLSQEIKQYAREIGFDACGICKAEDSGQSANYMQWLSEGCQAGMSYMERNIEKRVNPTLLVEGAKSIIMVALNYYPSQKQPEDVPQFAYYAYGDDYHQVVKEKLMRLFQFIKERRPEVTGRFFSDSAPVLERYWAAKAGIGFVGKHSLIIVPRKGSYLFLGELMVDIELEYDNPIREGCGRCTRCIDACPTGAIEKNFWVNAKKCISYQTIENKGDIDQAIIPQLSNNIYGCDICQQVCPWNRLARPHTTPEFEPSEEFLELDIRKLIDMDEDSYRRIFRHSAIKRAKYTGLKRNLDAVIEWKKMKDKDI